MAKLSPNFRTFFQTFLRNFREFGKHGHYQNISEIWKTVGLLTYITIIHEKKFPILNHNQKLIKKVFAIYFRRWGKNAIFQKKLKQINSKWFTFHSWCQQTFTWDLSWLKKSLQTNLTSQLSSCCGQNFRLFIANVLKVKIKSPRL